MVHCKYEIVSCVDSDLLPNLRKTAQLVIWKTSSSFVIQAFSIGSSVRVCVCEVCFNLRDEVQDLRGGATATTTTSGIKAGTFEIDHHRGGFPSHLLWHWQLEAQMDATIRGANLLSDQHVHCGSGTVNDRPSLHLLHVDTRETIFVWFENFRNHSDCRQLFTTTRKLSPPFPLASSGLVLLDQSIHWLFSDSLQSISVDWNGGDYTGDIVLYDSHAILFLRARGSSPRGSELKVRAEWILPQPDPAPDVPAECGPRDLCWQQWLHGVACGFYAFCGKFLPGNWLHLLLRGRLSLPGRQCEQEELPHVPQRDAGHSTHWASVWLSNVVLQSSLLRESYGLAFFLFTIL